MSRKGDDQDETKIHEDTSTKDTSNKDHIDTQSPYYLHASNHPGQTFVSKPFHDGNYGEWVVDMNNALYAKNKIDFVDGTITMPSVKSNFLAHWMRCNTMVKGWLKSSMDKEVRSSVRYSSTARKICIDLEERFAKESVPRVYELKHAITLLRQENFSVLAYFTKLKGLWDEARSISPWPKCTCSGCNCVMQKRLSQMCERERLYDFLIGLNDVFATIKT